MLREWERERRGLLGVTSCHHLTLAHCLAPFKLGDDSPKLFNECLHSSRPKHFLAFKKIFKNWARGGEGRDREREKEFVDLTLKCIS